MGLCVEGLQVLSQSSSSPFCILRCFRTVYVAAIFFTAVTLLNKCSFAQETQDYQLRWGVHARLLDGFERHRVVVATLGSPDHDIRRGWGDSPACFAGHAPVFTTVARTHTIAAISTSGGLWGEVVKCVISCVLCLKLLPGAVSVMTCFGLAAALPQTAEDLAARPPLPRSCHVTVEVGLWSGEQSVPLPSISTLLSFVCFDVAAW